MLRPARSLTLLVLGALLVVVWAKPAASQESGIFDHSFYSCEEDRPKNCRQVFFHVEDEKIAALLNNPQLAAAVPAKAGSITVGGRTLAQICGTTVSQLLRLIDLDKDNPQIAAYKVTGCTSEAELLWLARALSSSKELNTTISLAGLLVSTSSESGTFVMTDDLLVGTEAPAPRTASPTTARILAAVGIEFSAADPFAPNRALVRGRTSDLPSPVSPLELVDVLTCMIAGNSGDCVSAELSPAEAGALGSSLGAQGLTVAQATAALEALVPLSIQPTLIPVSPKGRHAGFDTWLKAEKKSEDSLTTSITFNSVSNETEERDHARLSIDAKAGKGTYPGELTLSLGAQLEFDDDDIEENVTQLIASYDHYFRPWLEVYGFVERFSNNFLGIDQRWEAGGGVLLEYDLRTRSEDNYCRGQGFRSGYDGRTVALTRRARDRMSQFRSVLRNELLRKGSISRTNAEDYCKYAPGVSKRNARLQLGLAISALTDFEQPDGISITPEALDPEGNVVQMEDLPELEITPESTQRQRLTLRPTITFRPATGVELDARYYWKSAIGSDGELDDGGSDVRTTLIFRAEFVLSESDPKMSLTGTWTRYKDTQPPRVSALDVHSGLMLLAPAPMPLATAFDGTRDGMELLRFDGLVAPDTHTEVKFGAKITF